MLLVFLSWIYMLFTSLNVGFGVTTLLKINKSGLIFTLINGLFGICLLTCFWAFFGRINFEFHLFLLALSLLLYFRNRNAINRLYASFRMELQQLIWPLKIFLSIIAMLIVAQCTTAPFVIDNETYYIQTVKWLNEYGFVKGLANLHISFGQMSGWHILQSAFSFSFLYKNFNDLSGFCLLLGNCFAVTKLNDFFLKGNRNALIVGLFPLGNVLFFQMINAPSPDIPIYVFAFILFYIFLESFENPGISDFNQLTVLALFVVFVKVTAIGLLLIPVVFLAFNFRKMTARLLPTTLMCLLVFFLFVAKNSIVSGLPFFPLSNFRLLVDYTVPESCASFFFNSGKLCMFFISAEEFHSGSKFGIAMKWLFAPKITGFINLLTVLILLASPFFIFRWHNKKAIWLVYFISVIDFTILLLTSPVYRYFIYLTLFFGLLIFASLFRHKKLLLSVYGLSIAATAVVLFFPLHFDSLTRNKLISQNSYFTVNNMVFPHRNSKLGNSYKLVRKGNLNYYSPNECPFFWANGDGDLPCVNQQQLDYLEKYLLVLPQLRTTQLKDGFYTKKTDAE